jgi:hypothetical protein
MEIINPENDTRMRLLMLAMKLLPILLKATTKILH